MSRTIGKKALRNLDAILGRHRPRTEIQHDNINGYVSPGAPQSGQPTPEPGSRDDVNSLASGLLELKTPEQLLEEGRVAEVATERERQGMRDEIGGMMDEVARTMGGLGVEKVVFADDNTRLTVDENGQTHREGGFEIDCRAHNPGSAGPDLSDIPDNIPDNIHEYNKGCSGGT